MNFRAVVLSSVAALSFGSASYAADAIVAAEPEPMEYVRVCDAFGAGFFYIPGSETCLKIGGYVRFQTDVGRNQSGTSDWDSFTRAQLELDTRSDTELGAVRGFIGLRGNADNGGGVSVQGVGITNVSNRGVNVDQAFIEVAGLKAGFFYSWWDDDLSGETDILSSHTTQYNAVRYTYTAGAFYAGIAAEELEGQLAGSGNNLGITSFYAAKSDNNVGVSGTIGFAMGPVTANVIGSYDTDAENGAVRGIASAKIGPGTASIAGVWASGANAYYEESEWTVAAEYALAVNDKLSITPGFQYFGTVDVNSSGDFTGSRDAWRAGVTLDYKLAENLTTKIAANYQDIDGSSANGGGDTWTGFFRLQRGF